MTPKEYRLSAVMPALPQLRCAPGSVGKDPDILIGAFDGEDGLIDVDERTLEQSLP